LTRIRRLNWNHYKNNHLNKIYLASLCSAEFNSHFANVEETSPIRPDSCQCKNNDKSNENLDSEIAEAWIKKEENKFIEHKSYLNLTAINLQL
tara:strand:+ start:784 stop:1062 length:279 start_codon:yes stop_codon:yes gene_type:complete